MLISLLACDNAGKPIQVRENSPYFNAEAYIQACIAKMNQQSVGVRKTVRYNQEEDEQTFLSDTILWEQELVLFKNLSIHKNALTGMYQVDSLESEDTITTIYQLLPEFEQKSPTKRLKVHARNGNCIGVEGEYLVENLLYKTNYQLRWQEEAFYEIKGERKIRFSKRVTSFSILGEFEI